MTVGLLRPGHKCHAASVLPSLGSPPQVGASCCVTRKLSTSMEGPCSGELRPHVDPQHKPSVAWWSLLISGTPAPVQPSDDAALADILTAASQETLSKTTQLSCSQISSPTETNNIYCCFKPLNLGVTCYAAISNRYLIEGATRWKGLESLSDLLDESSHWDLGLYL